MASRLSALLNEVHRFIEERNLRFVLCGSSARKLKQAGVNLLTGRALHRAMHPFVPEELGPRFDGTDALRYGLLPIAAFHGQAVNVTNIAREAGVARTTAAGYIEILEETLLAFRLPAYQSRLRVRERKLPKLYWCDPGIVRTVKGASGPPIPEERGPLFEGLIAQMIRAYRDYRELCDTFSYWAPADRAQTEVDFLLQRDDRFVAVEAKAGRTFSETWCKGLRALRDLPGLCRRIVVYPDGPELRTEDGIEVVPLSRFSDLLAAGSLWN